MAMEVVYRLLPELHCAEASDATGSGSNRPPQAQSPPRSVESRPTPSFSAVAPRQVPRRPSLLRVEPLQRRCSSASLSNRGRRARILPASRVWAGQRQARPSRARSAPPLLAFLFTSGPSPWVRTRPAPPLFLLGQEVPARSIFFRCCEFS